MTKWIQSREIAVTAKYLLPCRCGQNTTVEPCEAGETVVCRCGTSVQVPTMLEMSALEPVPAEPVPPHSPDAWRWQQSLVLLGCVSLIFAAVLACLFFSLLGESRRPK